MIILPVGTSLMSVAGQSWLAAAVVPRGFHKLDKGAMSNSAAERRESKRHSRPVTFVYAIL